MRGGGSGPKGRSCGPSGRSDGRGQGGDIGEGKEPSFTRTEPRGERSKNGSHSPVWEGARLPLAGGCGQRLKMIRKFDSALALVRVTTKIPTEHLHSSACRARTNREHCPMLGSTPAVEKRDGARQDGDLVPALGLGSLGQAHISRRASWPVASIR